MLRPAAACLVAALLLALAARAQAGVVLSGITPATPRHMRLDGPEGPSVVLTESAQEAELVKQIAAGLAVAANAYMRNIKLPEDAVVIASTPPGNVSAEMVKQAIGVTLASAVLDARARRTLGDPSFFPYNDGTGRVALYRLPKRKARGTCIFVHGCKHDPYSWFYKSRKCPMCTGLPEEVSHTKQCLARGYAVLALMSKNREYRNRCFSSSGNSELSDQADSAAVIKAWTKKFGLSKKPKYMFGISSGAAFAIKFPGTMKIEGVVSEVNMPWAKSWGLVDEETLKLKVPFPPVAYYMMERDEQTTRQINAAIRIFEKNNVPADYIFIPARPVTKSFLSDRSMHITRTQSAQIQAALRKIGVLDAKGMVTYDVRLKRKWVSQLPKILPWLKRSSPYYNLISDESQIWQELNLAWSWHEIVSDYVRPTLAWLEQKGKANLGALVRRYDLRDNIACLTEKREGC